MILYYPLHCPKPEKETLLLDMMRPRSLAIKNLPAMSSLFSRMRHMAGTVWDSQEAFQATLSAMGEILKDIPFDEWEARPFERHLLTSVIE